MASTTQLSLTPEITMVDRTTTTAQLQATTHHEEEEALNTAPPPPYTDADDDGDSDSDSDHDPSDIWERLQRVTISAGRTITGVGNLVSPASLTSLVEVKSFSATLLAAVAQLSNTAGGRRRRLNVDLTINCGITINGHRNVVGFGMKRDSEGKSTPSVPGSTVVGAAVAGAKRKADNDETIDSAQPGAKRIATEGPAGDELYDA